MIKKYGSFIVSIAIVIVVVGAFIYQRSIFLSSASSDVVSTSTAVNVSAKSITSAIDLANLYKANLTKVSSVPLSIDSLQTNPKPLFKASE